MRPQNLSIRLLGLLALAALATMFAINASAAPQRSGESVSVTISSDTGGELTSPDGLVNITFPPDLFSESTQVTYTDMPEPALPDALASAGPAFTLEAVRVSDGEPVVLFDMGSCPGAERPPSAKYECDSLPEGGMEISIHYADIDVARAGITENALTLSYFHSQNGDTGKWLPLSTVIDEEQNLVRASTWHFTSFALVGLGRPAVSDALLLQTEVIVDDNSFRFRRFQAGQCADPPDRCWWDYYSSGTYGGHSYYTMNSNDYFGRENWGEWTPYLPESGDYEIFAFIPWNYATTTNAHYHIYRYGGEIGTASVNQLNIYADWASLGTYYLPAGTNVKVYLDDMTGNQTYASEYIGFDALKFVCQGCGGPTSTPGPTSPPLPTNTPTPPPQPFRIDSVHVLDSNGDELPWDGLANGEIIFEARGSGSNPPMFVQARVTSLQSNVVRNLLLRHESTAAGTHIYRIDYSARYLVASLDGLTVAAAVYEQEDFDYEVAEEFMNKLGVPQERQMGIAWGNGDQSRNRPPANLTYLRAAGYEGARVEMVDYPGVTEEFFVQNQADVLFYLGHGWHDANYLCVAPGTDAYDCTEAHPSDIGNHWTEGLQTVAQLGCSVLDINDMNGWWGNTISPGKAWVALPGPQTWLGFQHYAPTIGTQKGEEVAYALATEHAAGESWVDAWRNATDGSLTTHKAVGGVAIEECNYYYWKEHCYPIVGCVRYTWESESCDDWNSSSQGLEILMASPAEVHIYDQQGRHVGPNEQGGVDLEIPESAYWKPIVLGEPDTDARRASIRTADLSHGYWLELVGMDEGVFSFHLEIPDRSTGTLYQTTYVSVPVSSSAVFALTLERGADFVLAMDADNDGVFEGQVVPTGVSTRPIDLPVNLTLAGTEGENGWYISDVTAALSGSMRPDLSPIVNLEYDLGTGWQTYHTPLSITQEGTFPLYYRGSFADGSMDVTQWVNIAIDKTPPVITITQPAVITHTLCSTFSVEYETYDAISGIEVVTATFDGQVITNGQTFDVLFLTPGTHEIVVTALDRAGWQTVQTRTIIVEVTIEGLVCAKHKFYDMGWIYGPGAKGIVNSLDAKLEAAMRARDRGQLHTAANIINAFVHEVEAQTDKHITPEAAAILIRGAQYITNQSVQQIPVSPRFGGSLVSPDDGVSVDFPPGAVPELTIATYRLTAEPHSFAGTWRSVGSMFELAAVEYSTSEPIGEFLHPVTITVQYSEDGLVGVEEIFLALHYWDNGDWVEVLTEVDEPHNRAVAQVNHFTTYTLLEQKHSIYLPLVIR